MKKVIVPASAPFFTDRIGRAASVTLWITRIRCHLEMELDALRVPQVQLLL